MANTKLHFAATVIALQVRGVFASPQCYWPNGGAAQSNYVPCSADKYVISIPLSALKGKLVEAVSDKASADTNNFQNLLSCSNGNLATSNGFNTWCCGTGGSSTCCSSAFQLAVPSDPNIGLTGEAFMPDVEEPSVTITSTITATITSTTLPSNGIISTTVTTVVVSTSTAISGSDAGLSKGAVAGISVAAAIGGALIGLAIALRLLHKRSIVTTQDHVTSPRDIMYHVTTERYNPLHIAHQQTVYSPPKPPLEIEGSQVGHARPEV
ncbi:hypothetical protein G7Y89_g15811 [Cudoniella acicularis]|uniref:Mid2 domain-containing protein n=1 Tax=Cudoniella acicularis TaxID=354080 RepID=A0A8H4QF15_9HELO|nr:hypothetical protein G7Y89_g15811 [Cudoniella acicularis]